MPNPNLKENKYFRALAVSLRDAVKFVSKQGYISLQYKYITHHKLNWSNPKRYTEKLQILRYYYYPLNPLVSKCAGRVGVREYLKELGLESHLIKVYGVYDNFNDINFSTLPDKFVMKCTHGSGMNHVCFDKTLININDLRKKFTKWLNTNYGNKTVEQHYSPIKPQIIIEELILENRRLPIEYKIHCFNGKAKYLYVVTDRNKDIRYSNFYIDWKPFDGAQFNGWNTASKLPEKPANFEKMIQISEILSKNFPFVRVDLFSINNKIYFNELTFTPAKGTLIFDDDKADFEIGEWLNF